MGDSGEERGESGEERGIVGKKGGGIVEKKGGETGEWCEVRGGERVGKKGGESVLETSDTQHDNVPTYFFSELEQYIG